MWVGLAPLVVSTAEPSPKFQLYEAIVPSLSVEPLASKDATRPLTELVNAAVGAALLWVMATWWPTEPVAPALSVTVNVTV